MAKRTWKFRVMAVGLSLLVALLLGELGLRVAGVSAPAFYQADAIAGTAHIPGAEGDYHREGRSHVRINADGWRDRDRRVEKRPGTLRVALLGDSYTSAFQVEFEETFGARIEKQLAAQHAEVLNFGVSGYGTAQELLTLRHRVWEYDPDIVLLAFFAGNDVADNFEPLSGAEHIPYFVYKGDDLLLDDSFRGSGTYRFRNGAMTRFLIGCARVSRIVQLAIRLKKGTERKAAAARQTRSLHRDGFWEFGLHNALYVDPPPRPWVEAWRVTEGILDLMDAECREHHAILAVVTLTTGAQVHPDASLRSALQENLGVQDLFAPERHIQAWGRRRQVPVLALAPEFQRRAEAEKVFLHGFGDTKGTGHWNETGHRWAADRIAPWLVSDVVGKPK